MFKPEEITHVSIGALRFPLFPKSSYERKVWHEKPMSVRGSFLKAPTANYAMTMDMRQELFQIFMESI